MNALDMNAELLIKHDNLTGVFYVFSSNVPGLHAEADQLDELLTELETLIPALRKANETNKTHQISTR